MRIVTDWDQLEMLVIPSVAFSTVSIFVAFCVLHTGNTKSGDVSVPMIALEAPCHVQSASKELIHFEDVKNHPAHLGPYIDNFGW